MLFVLHDTLNDKTDDFFESIATAIENIATAAREGKHILVGSRELLQRLSGLSFISPANLASIRKCREQAPEYGNLKHSASDFVQVMPDGEATVDIVNGQRVITVPIRKFADTSMIQETILIGENLLDIRFYKIVARVYASKNKMGKMKIRSDGQFGGGTTTVDLYQKLQDEDERFCLCVVDSDKRFPGSGLGTIAQKIVTIDDNNKTTTRQISLLCREAENMISLPQLESVCEKEVSRVEALRVLGKIESCDHEARFYIDLKNGLKIANILKLQDKTCRQYWINSISDISSLIGTCKSPCLEGGECCGEEKNCKCAIMPGFGEAILKNVVDKLERYSIPKVAEMISGPVIDEWMRVGRIVFSWCVGKERQLA